MQDRNKQVQPPEESGVPVGGWLNFKRQLVPFLKGQLREGLLLAIPLQMFPIQSGFKCH